MDWFYALIYGIIEGITEFLPISSTGHLIITGYLLGVPWEKEIKDTFEIIIQGGAILSVIVYYFKDFSGQINNILSKDKEAKKATINLWLGVVAACIPAFILGMLFSNKIKEYLFNPSVVAYALIVGGILIYLLENKKQATNQISSIENIGIKRAFLIGALQCLALLWPGFSRSASSILGGMLMKLDRQTATKFSFYLGIPTLGGAALIDFVKSFDKLQEIGLLIVFIGGLSSFVVAYLSINWLLKFVATNNFKPFAIYRIIAGLCILLMINFGDLNV